MPAINSDVLADLPAPTQQQHASAYQAHNRLTTGPARGAESPSGLNTAKVRLCRYFGTASGMYRLSFIY